MKILETNSHFIENFEACLRINVGTNPILSKKLYMILPAHKKNHETMSS